MARDLVSQPQETRQSQIPLVLQVEPAEQTTAPVNTLIVPWLYHVCGLVRDCKSKVQLCHTGISTPQKIGDNKYVLLSC